MNFRHFAFTALAVAIGLQHSSYVSAQGRPLTLRQAVQEALAANPKLRVAEHSTGIAEGKRWQAEAIPNPELSLELDDALGSGQYRGFRVAETTLQISQLIELGGKRDVRVAAASAELDNAHWERAATRLEVASETAAAFIGVLSAQRRIQIYDEQIAALDKLTPLLQRRVETGASSPAEISRAQIAADLVRVERERARTALTVARYELATAMGRRSPNFGSVSANIARIGGAPSLPVILKALDRNPQLTKWMAVRAQRDAEIIQARLKSVPDVRASVAWRSYRETDDNAVRLGLSLPIPVFDRNKGGVLEAEAARSKADADADAAKAALVLTLNRAYYTMIGARQEVSLLRASALPKTKRALEASESGYTQGRFSLLELLDSQTTATQAALRELEALVLFHTALATIEGLTAAPVKLTEEGVK